MATSGTFTSGRYGNSYGPWLTLAWTQVSQSVANNTTTLDLTLRFHWDRSIAYTFHNRTGSVQGNSYTYSGSASGTSGSRVLKTQRVTITHNSNGAKSVTLSGNITGLGLTYSGNRINTMSVSGTANLNTIPRASTLSAFSFNANLKNGTANQINYTIDRKSSGFRHQIQLRDGNTTVKQWDNIDSNGASTLPLTATEVNTLLNRMASSTTKSYTLRVATRSGNNGGWIGSAVSRNATATVHADVKPTVSAVTLSQTGNPVSTHTLQGFSKIEANFTRSAGYGASISSSSIQVRRKSGGADSQTINSNSGTTSNPVSLNGVYEARGTARDSRGRTTHTAWATITVTAYSAPTITNFTAVRNGSTPATVNISRTTTHTVLGTSNHLTYTIQRRQGTGAWTNVNTGATGTVTTSGATGSATSTGNEVTQSYEFRLVVTDKLGGRAESLQRVSTQRVVLDIHKNEGVGIGKIHERGALDVDGRAYFRGNLYVNDVNTSNAQQLSDYLTASGLVSADTIQFWQSLPQGKYFIYPGNIPNQPESYGVIDHTTFGGDFNTVFYTQPTGAIYRKSGNNADNYAWRLIDRPESGSNSSGHWARFSDGTQICWWERTIGSDPFGAYGSSSWTDINRTDTLTWTYPASFTSTPSLSGGANLSGAGVGSRRGSTVGFDGVGSTNASYQLFQIGSSKFTGTAYINLIAIGRWK